MAGAEFIWQHSKDELERACALLAGVAILTTRGGEDPIRKKDAFVGRVSLPFFETTPPPPGVKRLALHTGPAAVGALQDWQGRCAPRAVQPAWV